MIQEFYIIPCAVPNSLDTAKSPGSSRMKAIFVLFDSLCRTAMGCYGPTPVRTPNFDRFAQRAVTFDTHFVGSLPCMPARRDLHTGRLNFMHRSWGPLEPFDNSFPEQMRDAGIHTHLVTDHMHYFEDGGSTYHGRFRTWDFIRGQEYDPWKAMVAAAARAPAREVRAEALSVRRRRGASACSTRSTREFMPEEKDFCLPRCFDSAFEFLDHNHGAKNWFLMLECFDPHEPFQAPKRFKEQYRDRLDRRRARLADVREGRRQRPRRSPRSAPTTRRWSTRVRPLLRPAARLLRPARPVEGHGAGALHRPRLPAGRARLVGQEPDALLHRDLAHPADRPSPAIARAWPGSAAAR